MDKYYRRILELSFILILLFVTACGSIPPEKLDKSLGLTLTPIADTLPIPTVIQPEPLIGLEIEASSAILMNAESGDVLFQKNIHQSLPIASMSKIMSELLILQAIDTGELRWEDKITISDYVYEISNTPGFSSVLLNKDEVYTVRELFNAMAIHSGNGATIALAEAISGSEEHFVRKMNLMAKQLGLKHSIFVNSTGLTNSDLGDHFFKGGADAANQMSANDLALLANYVIKQYPELLETTQQIELEFNDATFGNSNWMLPESEIEYMEEIEVDATFPHVDGLKTGYTKAAGYCFTGTVVIDDIRFISVIIGAEKLEDRFLQTKVLYNEMTEQLIGN